MTMRSKQTPQNSSDEDEARDRFGDSEEREAQTPPSNKRQCSFELKHGQNLLLRELRMSGTSCRLRLWTEKTGKSAQLLLLHQGGKEGERRPI